MSSNRAPTVALLFSVYGAACIGVAGGIEVDGGTGGSRGTGGFAAGGGISGSGGGSSGAGGASASGGGSAAGGGAASGGGANAGGGSGVYDIPTGTLLFEETFEDANFGSRGWYDGAAGALANDNSPGAAGTHAFECRWNMGGTGCAAGKPARKKLAATDRVFVSMYWKFSANYVGSGRAYHPHLFHFTTNKDGDYVGPASSHLTLYMETTNGKPILALTDTLHSDPNCILRNDGNFIGCNGDFSTYPFTEDRSVAACNGLVGDLQGHDCFDNGGEWYSSRSWSPASAWFSDSSGPRYKGDWHHVEAYFEMNSIQQGKGVPDGRVRLWVDGATVISHDHVLFRTASNADQQFTQFLILPYIGDGSPVQQSFFFDNLKVGTGYLP